MLSRLAPAKLNLSLRIIGERADGSHLNGYHLLDSLVAFLEWGDTLSVQAADELTLTLAGPYANAAGDVSHNSILKAARALQSWAGISQGAHITLDKHIPVGAGLGGGSTDAAAALRVLCELWKLSPDEKILQAIALGIGADVPACLLGRPLYMRGIGEIITPAASLPPLWVMLVNDGSSLLTADVYRCYEHAERAEVDTYTGASDAQTLATYLKACRNDLEPAAQSLCPAIADVLTALAQTPNCLLARMCGSGATCFGLYASNQAVQAAAQQLRKQKPGWWIITSRVLSS